MDRRMSKRYTCQSVCICGQAGARKFWACEICHVLNLFMTVVGIRKVCKYSICKVSNSLETHISPSLMVS